MPDITEAKVRALAKRCGVKIRFHCPSVANPTTWVRVEFPNIGHVRISSVEQVLRMLLDYAKSKGIPVEEDSNG